MARAIESGLPKRRIEECAARKQARIDSGKDVIVGVNRYQVDEASPLETLEVDNTAVREAQLTRLAKLRDERDAAACEAALAALSEGARGGENLLALTIDAARAGATVGEMSDALERVFGRHEARTETISGVYAGEASDMSEVRRSAFERARSSIGRLVGPVGPFR